MRNITLKIEAGRPTSTLLPCTSPWTWPSAPHRVSTYEIFRHLLHREDRPIARPLPTRGNINNMGMPPCLDRDSNLRSSEYSTPRSHYTASQPTRPWPELSLATRTEAGWKLCVTNHSQNKCPFFVACTFKYSHRHVKLKLSLCLTKHQAMKTYWGVEV
jgi:hypothetical protein